MKLSDEQRSMIATAVVAGFEDKRWSLCCGVNKLQACAAIVGKRHAEKLRDWCYDGLGCGDIGNARRLDAKYPRRTFERFEEERIQEYLDRVSELEL